jgi:dienelactone hydrolase
VVMIVHFFEATGTTWADTAGIARHSKEWLQALEDAVLHGGRIKGVDRTRIGLIGFSLGAYLSLALASRMKGIACVVDFFGGLPREIGESIESMPPVLILHGDADTTVPVSEAYRLEKILREKKIPYEIKIYPGVGHGFHASIGSAALDALMRTERFIGEQLGKGEVRS